MSDLSWKNEFEFLLNELSKRYKVMLVPRFRGLWVGCCGFYNGWDADEANCYQTICFAYELQKLGQHFSLSFSIGVDFGNVMGGFTKGSLRFDLYGQEIRWLMMIMALKGVHHIYISDTIKTKLRKYHANTPKEQGVHLQWKYDFIISIPWNKTRSIKVAYISNAWIISATVSSELLSTLKGMGDVKGNEEKGEQYSGMYEV